MSQAVECGCRRVDRTNVPTGDRRAAFDSLTMSLGNSIARSKTASDRFIKNGKMPLTGLDEKGIRPAPVSPFPCYNCMSRTRY